MRRSSNRCCPRHTHTHSYPTLNLNPTPTLALNSALKPQDHPVCPSYPKCPHFADEVSGLVSTTLNIQHTHNHLHHPADLFTQGWIITLHKHTRVCISTPASPPPPPPTLFHTSNFWQCNARADLRLIISSVKIETLGMHKAQLLSSRKMFYCWPGSQWELLFTWNEATEVIVLKTTAKASFNEVVI